MRAGSWGGVSHEGPGIGCSLVDVSDTHRISSGSLSTFWSWYTGESVSPFNTSWSWVSWIPSFTFLTHPPHDPGVTHGSWRSRNTRDPVSALRTDQREQRDVSSCFSVRFCVGSWIKCELTCEPGAPPIPLTPLLPLSPGKPGVPEHRMRSQKQAGESTLQ